MCSLPGSLLYLVNTSTQLLAINGGSIPLRRLPLCALTDLATTYPGLFFFQLFPSCSLFFYDPKVSVKHTSLRKLERHCSKSEGQKACFRQNALNRSPSLARNITAVTSCQLKLLLNIFMKFKKLNRSLVLQRIYNSHAVKKRLGYVGLFFHKNKVQFTWRYPCVEETLKEASSSS